MDTNEACLFVDWPIGHCPFNAIVVFPSETLREQFRSQLLAEGIYVTVHWVVGTEASFHSLDLSRRILTIPVDQRYGLEDLQRIVSVLSGSTL